jgi:hypothetical protein
VESARVFHRERATLFLGEIRGVALKFAWLPTTGCGQIAALPNIMWLFTGLSLAEDRLSTGCWAGSPGYSQVVHISLFVP